VALKKFGYLITIYLFRAFKNSSSRYGAQFRTQQEEISDGALDFLGFSIDFGRIFYAF